MKSTNSSRTINIYNQILYTNIDANNNISYLKSERYLPFHSVTPLDLN